MSHAIVFAPLIPEVWLAVLGALAAAMVLFAAWRRARGWIWRAALFAGLALLLADPRLVRENREALPDVALVLVDISASQDIGTRRTRAQAARLALNEHLNGLEDLETRTVEVTGSGPGGSDGTRLFAALEEALADLPRERFAGAVMITDGQVHDAPEKDAAMPPGPLHVLLTGEPDERDRRLVVDQAPGYGLVGKTAEIVFHVEDRPQAGNGLVTIDLRRDGETVGRLNVVPGTAATATVEIAHPGPNLIEIAAESLPGEISPVNNAAVVAVNGLRERLRVLLVSGQPHPGERTWRNLLKSDPAVDLVHFTILRSPEKNDFTPLKELALIAFPMQELFEEKLDEFDLIVFDRYLVRHVLPWDYFENIAAYLEAGGALLFASGPEFAGLESLHRTPLGALMPAAPTGEVLETEFQPRLSDIGRRHPVSADLAPPGDDPPPWGPWFRQVATTAAGGRTLMKGAEELPLVVLDEVGKGRIAQITSDQVWLWARGYQGGGPHAEIVRRLVHWLMKEPELEAEALRAKVREGRLEIERRSLEAHPKTVTVTTPEGDEKTVSLEPGIQGRATASLPAEAPGIYRVDDGTHQALAASGRLNMPELSDLRATEERLAPAVAAMDGSLRWLAASDTPAPQVRRPRPGRETAGHDWIGLTRNGAEVVTGIAQVPLLSGLIGLALTLGLLGGTWWREGR